MKKLSVEKKRKISNIYEYSGLSRIRKKIAPPEQEFGGSAKEKNRRDRKKIREKLKKEDES